MHVEMSGSDRRMDQKGSWDLPANPLPVRCGTCGFVDTDFVPEPYLLAKGTTSQDEMALAEMGNLLVRERVRKALELVCPGQCEFHPTFHQKSGEPTDWYLAVPRSRVRTAAVRESVPRCPTCGEPKVAHPGSHYEYVEPEPVEQDVFKSLNWSSAESIGEETPWYRMHVLGWKGKEKGEPGRWTRISLDRSLHFSVRLEALLKTMGARGLVRSMGQKAKAGPADQAWVHAAMERLAAEALVAPQSAPPDPALTRWYRAYLKKNAGSGVATAEVKRVETQAGIQLPPSYRDFVRTVGEKCYDDVDGEPGFQACVITPERLDYRSFRKGEIRPADPESAEIDGLLFATTGHGDCFVFNLAEAGPEYPVYLYDHEMNAFEAYAPSFAACIRRWAKE